MPRIKTQGKKKKEIHQGFEELNVPPSGYMFSLSGFQTGFRHMAQTGRGHPPLDSPYPSPHPLDLITTAEEEAG